MNELALFAGAGGGILAGQMLGWRTICAVEWEAYPASVLAARQNDGHLEPFPIWDDVRTFDGTPWRGRVDVVSGGFPCQDISAAGRGAGIDGGERSGLWVEMARIIGEVRPRIVFVENSPMLTSRGLGRVLGDLAALGFDAEWGVLGAADVGAPHQRDRIWIVAHSKLRGLPERWRTKNAGSKDGQSLGVCVDESQGGEQQTEKVVADPANSGVHERGRPDSPSADVQLVRGNERNGLSGSGDEEAQILAHASGNRLRGRRQDRPATRPARLCSGAGWHEVKQLPSAADWWQSEPNVGRVVNGVAARVDRLKAIGNGQVPQCAAEAFKRLTRRTQ